LRQHRFYFTRVFLADIEIEIANWLSRKEVPGGSLSLRIISVIGKKLVELII
jgi:hypothetical protein